MPEIEELIIFHRVCTALMEEGAEKYSKVAGIITMDLSLLACSIWMKKGDSPVRVGFHQAPNKEHLLKWLPGEDFRIAKEVIVGGQPVIRSNTTGFKNSSSIVNCNAAIVSLPLKDHEEIIGVISYWVAQNSSADFSNHSARELAQQIGADMVRSFRKMPEINSRLPLDKFLELTEHYPQAPSLKGLTVAPRLLSGAVRSGCFYEYIPNQEGLSISFGEVTGNSVAAQTMKVVARLVTRTLADLNCSPGTLVNKHNQALYDDLSRIGILLGLFFCSLNLKNGIFTYANGGHHPPILIREALKSIETLGATGPLLGLEEKLLFSENTIHVQPGDVIIFYSRGLPESVNHDGYSYNVGRLAEVVKRYFFYDAPSLLDYILMDFQEFMGSRPISEDILVNVVKLENLSS